MDNTAEIGGSSDSETYEPPAIVILGSLADLTKGVGGTKTDAALNASSVLSPLT
ncbi:MAG TPA: lasso RiPP family leader peptide-containing protein [Acidimicrobiales bacterium]|jgi:hypothetical protein|nr:lasso RiPP family leader peptide-containing protein [Acidimicrobiales bacterium]